jgi:hypothetical protein
MQMHATGRLPAMAGHQVAVLAEYQRGRQQAFGDQVLGP